MTTHLSVRLAWHDRGWDGHVCDNPRANSACMVIGNIREERVDAEEIANAGKHVADLGGWLPPCSRDIAAWSSREIRIVHTHPFADVKPTAAIIAPYACAPSPYRWMREENLQQIADDEGLRIPPPPKPRATGWVSEPPRQMFLLKNFWGKLEPRKSLLFFYSKEGTPVDEDAPRIIVGVGRLNEIADQEYFVGKNGVASDYPIWSRSVQQRWPEEGVRLPYQEYLQAGLRTDAILCRVPGHNTLDFSYVAEHLGDDLAVSMLERVIQSVQQVILDGKVAGEWERQLQWLNDALAEVWTDRGAYPGIGSVLQFLGCTTGTAYQRLVLAALAGKDINPWELLREQLNGTREIAGDTYRDALMIARERWQALKSQQPLLDLLVRFDLTTAQVTRIADADKRRAVGIATSEDEILANPYLLAEQDAGTQDSAAISLEVVDHGMRPEGMAAKFARGETLAADDRRRVRAVAFDVLRHAADSGDTLLSWDALWDAVERKFPDRRACAPNRQLVAAEASYYQEALEFCADGQVKWAALKHLRAHERRIAEVVKRRSAKTNDPSAYPTQPNWHSALLATFHKEPTEERELQAWAEKTRALETLFTRRVSVLTGGAGTGKTSVLRAFLSEFERVEGAQPLLLLAPTGKARVRLAKATGRPAQTIHQLLMRGGWLTPDFRLKDSTSQQPVSGITVVIDECSMMPTDLLGALLKAIKLNDAKRLILVGDPYQLPPIGPGRPFVDIYQWLLKNAPDCLASLRTCMRVDVASGQVSQGLQLAGAYRENEGGVGDEEVLAAMARGERIGDVTTLFWHTPEELDAALDRVLQEQLGIKSGDYDALNKSFGFAAGGGHEPERAEAWQILSPTRGQAYGTDAANRRMQLAFRQKLLESSRTGRYGPKPFGDQEVVYTDKVINVANHKQPAWPHDGNAADYIANGEIGYVVSTRKVKDGADHLDVAFSTQPNHTYRYWRSQRDMGRLELAYALTVHKAQGSDFETAIVIIPKKAVTMSRELLYTALTRFKQQLVLLVEHDIEPLIRLRSPETSATLLRNTFQFELSLRPDGVGRPYPEALIHRTSTNVAVRSKSEVIVADVLTKLDISYTYEKKLFARGNEKDFRLPDFTVSFDGDTFYWEHLGMLNLPHYKRDWERKQKWYVDNGYAELLLTSEDGPDGSIDAAAIEKLARERILGES